MPQVEVTEVMNAPIQRVWEAINDVESYPRLMDHVHSLSVVEEAADHRLVAWDVEIKGCRMRWVEREEAHPEQYRLDYRAVEGDVAEFSGYWQLEALGETTTRATVLVNFEIGIPLLSDMLNPVAKRAIEDNSRRMLQSIGAHLATVPAAPESPVTLN